jgi:FMN phosphatase YigB (HAD superfamily)
MNASTRTRWDCESDPTAYLHVSKALDILPNEIAFFDDSVKCVNGAIAVGMHGRHCLGFGELQIRLSELGILEGRTAHPWQG